jgi:hypothetical protein
VLSSRVSLAIGTVSLVAVTSIGTAVLVNDGAQRFPDPSAAGPREGMPSFHAPPLVVPHPAGEGATPPVAGPAGPAVLLPPAVTGEEPPVTGEEPAVPPAPPVVEPPTAAPPVVEPPTAAPPVVEPPTAAPPVVEPPTVAPPTVEPPSVDQDKGRHLGWYKQQLRGKGHHGGGPHAEDGEEPGAGQHDVDEHDVDGHGAGERPKH